VGFNMTNRTAFAIPELLVTGVVLPIGLCIGFVATSGLDEGAGISRSQANLAAIGAAHQLHAADNDGRVFSLAPDDYGAYDGCSDYIQNVGCLEPLLLGWGQSGSDPCSCEARWGYWIDYGQLCESVGSCGNSVLLEPIDFDLSIGSFRYPNCEQFNQYVNGRFYDSTFYAPLDTVTIEDATPLIESCCPFTYEGQLVSSSYAFSPSAMWDPGVLRSKADGGFQAPGSYDESHRAPLVVDARYPELKTLIFEHNWNHGQPGAINPAFAGGRTPYYFNHGRDATPLTCFIDGSVRMLRTGNVEADDERLRENGADGIWNRETPLGAAGYFSAQSLDGVVAGHNILTNDGILGRDALSTAMRDVDGNGDGSVDGGDLLGLLGGWGVDPGWNSPHDINADGVIDGADLNALLAGWSD
jgi:hypothetical protein